VRNHHKHAWLGRHIREMRVATGMTQITLAEALGKPQSYVAKIEGGERRVDVFEFILIVEALGGDPHEELEYVRDNLL
jgi:transcriptional regulator with XRE-family HTH domain